MATIGTRLFTMLKGRRVGADDQGNIYYEERRPGRFDGRSRRWVIYNGQDEASRVPAEWHAWLHYTTEGPLTDVERHSWQKPHRANMTGTAQTHVPRGHDARGGERAPATGDYQAWRPGQ